MTGKLGAILLLCAVAACDAADNSLDGSLSEVYSLGFESVRARLYSSELSIEYVDRYQAVPVRITLRRAEVEPAADHTYDLVEVGDITGRLPNDTEIPRFSDGSLELGAYLAEPGAEVSGSFDAEFATGRDSLSLSGDFRTTLELGAYLAEPGAVVSGSFDAEFATGRDSLGLSGDFRTTLEVVIGGI